MVRVPLDEVPADTARDVGQEGQRGDHLKLPVRFQGGYGTHRAEGEDQGDEHSLHHCVLRIPING